LKPAERKATRPACAMVARRSRDSPSGVTLAGIGSAFWGIVAGVAVRAALRRDA